jgi:ribonuclease BN (tRNA processing enzyme)
MSQIRVVFLGTGDAFAAGGRHQAACMIQTPEGSLLLDCGPTTLTSLKRHNLPIESIESIFLSHFHGDHFAGLPFLFLEYLYVIPRSKPLKIVGPPGVEKKVMLLYRTLYPDTAAEPLPYALEFIEAQPERSFSVGGTGVCPFRAIHQEQPISLGFEFLISNRKIVYSGDTGWTEDLVTHSQKSDLLICECSYFETRLATHLDYPRILENLPRLGSKRIVLTHLGEEVLRRRQDIGLELASDGLVVTL